VIEHGTIKFKSPLGFQPFHRHFSPTCALHQ
jgi:hypothetical protein